MAATLPTEISASCPHCTKPLSYPEKFLGMISPCPYCKRDVLLTDPGSASIQQQVLKTTENALVEGSQSTAENESGPGMLGYILGTTAIVAGVPLAIVVYVGLFAVPAIVLGALAWWTLGFPSFEKATLGGAVIILLLRIIKILFVLFLLTLPSYLPCIHFFNRQQRRRGEIAFWTTWTTLTFIVFCFTGCFPPMK